MHAAKTFALVLCLLVASWHIAAAQGANLMANEGSPYLRQHKDDLVHWMPWGDAAFERAKLEDKPVFLSIGYSTCYWCHVMRRESFTDPDTAKLINDNFVAVLVDRERRPDVDETYALVTQLISGVGGWPTNAFLTPDRKPFYATVYVPQDILYQTLEVARDRWANNRADMEAEAEQLSGIIHRYLNRREAAVELTPDKLHEASAVVISRFDADYGGVVGGAKFMRPALLLFLLRQAEAHQAGDALEAVETTLRGVLNGGVHDHVGGGLHRYAEDAAWRVPHFEKMLYDQALMAQAMLRAYALTGQERYLAAARGTFNFVLEHLSDPSGGFLSALDAASGEEEGKFYLWTLKELEAVLGAEDKDFAVKMFGVTEEGNFKGTNILYLRNSPVNLAGFYKLDVATVKSRITDILARLAAVRQGRTTPATDEKIITSWNAAMTVAFAEAADRLGDGRYRQIALANGAFLWTTMRSETGGFRRSYFSGELAGEGTLLDNAYAALAFIALYDLTEEADWLDRAVATASFIVENFRDDEAGDYYMTLGDIAFGRTKLRNDGDMPSGNAVMLDVLSRLSKRTLEPEYLLHAEALLAAVSGMALGDPVSHAYTLLAGDQLLRGERAARQFAAKGRVRAGASLDADGTVRVTVTTLPGWHINSNRPLEEDFIATEVAISGADVPADQITYPEGVERTFGFHDQPLSVYEGEVEITAKVGGTAQPISVELTVQACNDQICLLPETVTLGLDRLVAMKAN